jgi:hypothetical protein
MNDKQSNQLKEANLLLLDLIESLDQEFLTKNEDQIIRCTLLLVHLHMADAFEVQL